MKPEKTNSGMQFEVVEVPAPECPEGPPGPVVVCFYEALDAKIDDCRHGTSLGE
jgi:hypothetical protein